MGDSEKIMLDIGMVGNLDQTPSCAYVTTLNLTSFIPLRFIVRSRWTLALAHSDSDHFIRIQCNLS
jgi:hypothetical protein